MIEGVHCGTCVDYILGHKTNRECMKKGVVSLCTRMAKSLVDVNDVD
jgi:hypothetical protein